MNKVIFICRGNLIRSQICKAIYNQMAKDGSYAESYGTEVKQDGNERVKIESHGYLSNLVKIMKEHGLDISKETSKQLTEENVTDASKIIFMGRKKNIPDWLEKYNYEYWDDCTNEVEKNKDLNLNIKIPKFGDTEDIENTIQFFKNKVKNFYKNS